MKAKSKEMPLGRRLGVLAKAKTLKQKEIAIHSDLSVSQVNRFLNGQSEVKAEKLIFILETLGIDLNEILDKELSKASGVILKEENEFGTQIEKITRSMKPSKREAFIDFITAYALHNASAQLKSEILELKELI